MKSEKTLELNGKEINLKFEFGAIEDFCEEFDIGFSQFDKELDKPKGLRTFVYYMAKAGGSDIEKDELRSLSLEQMKEIGEVIRDSQVGKAAAKKAK